jgi:hypothetical protein
MPPSRTTSGATRPPASAASPPATSPSTPSGSNSASRRSTCRPGCASCWTGNWSPPSRRSYATDCCTAPHASPTAADAYACGYQRPGPGDTNWPRHSTASPHCPSPRLTSKPLTAHDPKDLGEPNHRAETPLCPSSAITVPTAGN